MRALIIGATRGIGLGLTQRYLADGWHVTATARREADLPQLQSLGAKPLKLDVTLPSSIMSMEWVLAGEQYDLVIYVAGILSRGPATAVPTQAEFDLVMHTNVLGMMQLLPCLAPKLANQHGKWIAISSGMGSIAEAQSSANWLYRVSKAALNMAIRSAAFDYPAVTFAALCPGWVKTDMGGPQATLEVADSVQGLRQVIAGLSLADSGCYKNHLGHSLSW
ncbi:SDR family oxidoreductase [Parvibium lacunae]|uniref:Short chain dehydrogenase n=1 Tax=Parvibium lacunae TaxID=1888893 RepID=A0A368L617_9BURK|nr:SDR family oxidoreductase [Parvibium lacunae]RCS58590.1 short chain dehydrogenase [Parvibium lacunae]